MQGAFTELRMTDVQDPPQYEARVYIGIAPDAGTWILEIEASQPGGVWQHFARYDIRRN